MVRLAPDACPRWRPYNFTRAEFGPVLGCSHHVQFDMITVLLIADNAATRSVLRLRLDLEADVTVVGDDPAAELEPAVSAVDVAVIDIVNPLAPESSTAARIRDLAARFPVVLLSLHEDPVTRSTAEQAGVRAFVSKHEADAALIAAIRGAASSGI